MKTKHATPSPLASALADLEAAAASARLKKKEALRHSPRPRRAEKMITRVRREAKDLELSLTGMHGSSKSLPAHIVAACLVKHHTGTAPETLPVDGENWPFDVLADYVWRAVIGNDAGRLRALSLAVSAVHKRSTGTGKAFVITPQKPATRAAIEAARLCGEMAASGDAIRKASADLGAGNATISTRHARRLARKEGVKPSEAGRTSKPKAKAKPKPQRVSNKMIRDKADEALARLKGGKPASHPWKTRRTKTGKKVS